MFWNSDNHIAADRIGWWADVLCQAFTPLEPRRTSVHLRSSRSPDGMSGWVRARQFGQTSASTVASCSQLLTHGRNEVRRSDDEFVFVNLQLAGQCRAEQDGRQSVVRPGEFALFDTTRPYSLDYFEEIESGQPWKVLCFRTLRSQVEDLISPSKNADSVFARAIPNTVGAGHVLAVMMDALWSAHGSNDEPARTTLECAYTQVLRTMLTQQVSDQPSAMPEVNAARRAAALRFAQSRLRHGAITAEGAARSVAVSTRTLHKLFADEGTTFGASVRHLRVQAAARDLCDARWTRSVTQIAADWGYADSAHMAKAFRLEFGQSPSDYRQCALSRESEGLTVESGS